MAAEILPQAKRFAFNSRTIHCRCGKASIPAPPGATPETTFTCRECCARAMAKQAKKPNRGVYYIGGPTLDSGLRELVG